MEINENKSVDRKNTCSTSVKKVLNFKTALNDFISLFIKIFGTRALYSIIQNIIGKKNGLNLRKAIKFFLRIFLGSENTQNFNLISIVKEIFTSSNLRTSLSIALVPFIYKLLKLTFKNICFREIYPNLTTFLFGFIASFLSIIIEEKTKLVHFLVVSILVRVFHLIILDILKKYHILQNTGRTFDLFYFLISSSFMMSIGFLNPDFKSITALLDEYACFPSKDCYEYLETIKMRNITRIV